MSDREKVMSLRMKGKTREEIAKELDLSVRSVDQAINTTITELRDAAPLIVEEMFSVHQLRLEALYQIVQKKIDEMLDFDERLFKVALSILERQSKLLGLDRDKVKTKTSRADRYHETTDWLEDATPSELIHEAESYGITVPEKFKLVGEG